MSVSISTKKGFVNNTVNNITSVNAKWYYNWGYTNANLSGVPINSITGFQDIKFTPMIWGLKTLPQTSDLPPEIPNYEDVLLGFNEPDGTAQSNIQVTDAIKAWPQLMATGRRLGSPATAGNPTSQGSWLSQFMASARTLNYRVDFICVHWYAPPNATSFLAEIDKIYQMYELPIWITEFSPADWKASTTVPAKFTQQDAINFMNAVIPELEKRPYVERYTWKTRTTEDVNLGFAALFNDDGSLTPVGEAYAKF